MKTALKELPISEERSITMFLAFTGCPTTEDIERKLDVLAAGGVNSFILYPTSGLGYEYLGKDFFNAARAFAAGAKRRGMKMWLYDEYNWPSGSCMGRVTAANDDFREKHLAMIVKDGKITWQLAATPDYKSDTSWCTGGIAKGWPNLLEPHAVKLFTELTHDAYARELSEYFDDGTIRGIFTDEPFTFFPEEWLPEGTVHSFRWYDGFENDYSTLTGGRSFRDDMEAWYKSGHSPEKADVWIYANKLYARRFQESFWRQIRDKADELGILSTGHMMEECDPVNSAATNGDPLAALSTLSFPGMDEIFTNTDPGHIEWLTLHTIQYAVRKNNSGGMAELFSLGPANRPPEEFLKMIRICAFHGVTRYFTVMSAMDASWMDLMHGFTVGIGDQQPWFAEFPLFMDAADAASAIARKRAVFDVALRFPHKQSILAGAGIAPYPLVNHFLLMFECGQIGVELIREDDPTTASAIFSFRGTDIYEEKSGLTFPNLKDAYDWAARNTPERFTVKDANGNREPNTLVRNFEDGTHEFLRLDPTSRQDYDGTAIQIDGNWKLTLSADPTLRIPFDTNGICHMSFDEPLNNVRLATRGNAVFIDGVPVSVNKPCDFLRPTFDPLYKQSECFNLSNGTHEFRLPDGMNDMNWFLPAAFLAEPYTPREVPAGDLDSYRLGGFCGTATWTKTVDVPDASLVRLRLATGGHFTRVILGGRDLGAIGWGDFTWTIPDDLHGKQLEMSIIIRTSLIPLFGECKAPGTKYYGYSDPRPCGLLEKPTWCF